MTAGASCAMPRAAGVPIAGGTSRATASPARYARYDVRAGRIDTAGWRRSATTRRGTRTGGALGLRTVRRPPLRQAAGARFLSARPAVVTRAARSFGRGLAPHLDEALHRGDRGEHEHDPEHRHEDVEREP